MIQLTFSHQEYLFLLFLVPLAIAFHFFSIRSNRKSSLKFANFDAIAKVNGIDFYSKGILNLLLDIIFVLLLVLALSGLTLHREARVSAFSLVIAIDSSQSMNTADIAPNRLVAAKQTAKDFVDRLPYTNIGVVSFAGTSLIETDLIKDKSEIKNAIDRIETSAIGGTDIYDAVVISSSLLKDEKFKSIILLSDGQLNVGSIVKTIEYAKEREVMVHTIGIGTQEGGAIDYGISRLDEDSLKALSYNTGGKYFNVINRENLSDSFNQILSVTSGLDSASLSNYLLIASLFVFFLKEVTAHYSRII